MTVTSRLLGVAVAITLALTLSSCDWRETLRSPEAQHEVELRRRPSFEQGEKNYEAMILEIRSLLAELAPDVKWTGDRLVERSWGVCTGSHAADYEANQANYDVGYGKGAIPGSAWPEVKAGIIRIAADYGFTGVNLLVDKPDDKQLTITNDTGGSVEVGTADNTTLSVFGSCMIRETPRATTPSATPIP